MVTVREAAERLKISRRTVNNRINSYGLRDKITYDLVNNKPQAMMDEETFKVISVGKPGGRPKTK